MLIQAERLKALPIRLEETWLGGLVRMPIPDAEQPPLFLPLWLSVEHQSVNELPDGPTPIQRAYELSLTALVDFAEDPARAGYRPGRVEVSERGLAEFLASRLAGTGIGVEHKPDGLAPLDEVIEHMQGLIADQMGASAGVPDPLPDMLSVGGVTVDQVRSFAEAAYGFYESAPWESLTDEDLIHVASPKAPEGMGWFTVLGAGGQTLGLGFFHSREQYEAIYDADSPDAAIEEADGTWSVQFGPPDDLPPKDAELWQSQGLPVAGPDAYPIVSAMRVDGQSVRPDARQLAWAEGLMRVLAGVTEKELDACRWRSKVQTALGTVTYKLSLPDMTSGRAMPPIRSSGPSVTEQMLTSLRRIAEERGLESPEQLQEMMAQFTGKRVPDQPGRTPLELAQDLIFQAYEQSGRRKLKLAKQALKVCPDCADAYVLLAEATGDPDRQIELLTQGVEAGRRALGPSVFERDAGHFWGTLETRPYMRARFGLAQCLEYNERPDEAIEHYRELLRLNPNDNQGVRDVMGPCLLELDRDEEALALCRRYPDDFLAMPLYVRALAEFRLHGNTPGSQKALRRAVKANPYVRDYLLEEDFPLTGRPDAYSPGSEEEASICFDLIDPLWLDTPDAMVWLLKYGNPEGPKPKQYKQRKNRSR